MTLRHSTVRRGDNGNSDIKCKGWDPDDRSKSASSGPLLGFSLPRIISFSPPYILVLLLCCLCCLMNVCQGADQKDFLAGTAKAAEVDIFVDPEHFEKRAQLFETIGPEQMKDMIQHVLSQGWLPQLAAAMTETELDVIFQTNSLDMVAAAMPLLNVTPDNGLGSLTKPAWKLIWEASQREATVPFEESRLAKMQPDRQTALLPSLPIGLRVSLAAPVLLHWVQNGRCDQLPMTILLKTNIDLARHLTGDCTRLLQGKDLPPMTIDSSIMKLLPVDAFEEIPPKTLAPKTYAQMSANQLANHLVRNAPNPLQIKPISGGILARAIELLASQPANCALVSPNLFTVLPASVMKHFGEIFWANADASRVWSLPSSHLINLPSIAWAAVHPAILRQLLIKPTSSLDKANTRIGELLARMGTIGRSDGEHPCASPLNWLQYVAPNKLEHLTGACIEAMEPTAMSVFTSANHLNALNDMAVEALQAAHMANIPAIALTDNARAFLTRLMRQASNHYRASEVERVACAGLQPEHLVNLRSTDSWSLFNYECFSVLPAPTLNAIPAHGFQKIPPSVFRRLPMAPDEGDIKGLDTMRMILQRISKDQLAQLGEDIVIDEQLHPCYGVIIEWETIGEGDASLPVKPVTRGLNRVAQGMPARCFSLLDPLTYERMGEGSLASMADGILELINDPGRFATIPPAALVGLRPVQARHLAEDALILATTQQIVALGKNRLTLELPPERWASLPIPTLVEVVKQGTVPLPETVLAAFTATQFYDGGEWIESIIDRFSRQQWNQLGAANEQDRIVDEDVASKMEKKRNHTPHPCVYIDYQHVKLHTEEKTNGRAPVGTNFWQGLNARCLASFSFLAKIQPAELDLIPDAAFSLLTNQQRDQLAPKMGNRLRRLYYAINCGEYPPEQFATLEDHQYGLLSASCYQNISLEVWKAFPPSKARLLPNRAFKLLDAVQLAALPAPLLEALSPTQLASLSSGYRGLGCAGLHKEQRLHLSLEHLTPTCFHNVSPEFLDGLTSKEFARLPMVFWEEAIGREQVAAIPASLFTAFSLEAAQRVGIDWRASPALHPLLGFTEPQLATMSVAARDAILRARSRLPPDESYLVGERREGWRLLLSPLVLGAICTILGLGAITGFYVYYYHGMHSTISDGASNVAP